MYQLGPPALPLVLCLQFCDGVNFLKICLSVAVLDSGRGGRGGCVGGRHGNAATLGHLRHVYRSSLSTRPPGCSGLESGKKAAFTSRPFSVRAA